MKILYFDVNHAISVHDKIIQKSGGNMGTINIGLLESTLAHIQNDIYYPTFESKANHLFYSINKNHAFTDGNKRSSIALCAYFMEINGFGFKINYFLSEIENIAVDVADNRIDKELLQEIITSLLYESGFCNKLKMKIINAKMKQRL
ncbi:type II toxin-antitoxin system death-on-curing family toxin [Brumimicrobium glaciale]|uniref:Type II toxin-antitoxin system death-on-curing family toxin n=1 Tax=Brumimicrobium glaciale TaxID=200475 RepID=A0A4Q4KHK1_9FLAO|nr:type II toxin-antitoxin system death-on-curing family toxin [Brumimicrobium glaciale]